MKRRKSNPKIDRKCLFCGITQSYAKNQKICLRDSLFGRTEVKRHKWEKLITKE